MKNTLLIFQESVIFFMGIYYNALLVLYWIWIEIYSIYFFINKLKSFKNQNKKNDRISMEISIQDLLKQQPSQKYKLSSIKATPSSVAMTATPKQIIKIIYQLPFYVWIDPHVDSKQQEKQKLQKELEERLHSFKTVAEASLFIKQQKCIVIICCTEVAEEVEKVFSFNQSVTRIYCQCNSVVQFNNLKANKMIGHKFKESFSNLKQQIQLLKKYRYQDYVQKTLPNFLMIEDEIEELNILVRTMFVMIRQETNRIQIMQQFQKLWKNMSSQRDIKDLQAQIISFTQQVKKQALTPARAIRWYTKPKIIFKVLNNVLRSSRHPCQVFLLQPFFKDLFNAIKSLYSEQQKKNVSMRNFNCFRGGKISMQEIKYLTKNKGKMIQNLGFLSTSKNREKALEFKSNVLFIIQVRDRERSPEAEFGFADISKLSYFWVQQQVLFNPLNYFQVKKIEKKADSNLQQFQITLLYGEMARLMALNAKGLNKNELKLRNLGQQVIKDSMKYQCLGQILVIQHYKLNGSLQFWRQFVRVTKEAGDRLLYARGLLFLSFSFGPKEAILLLVESLKIRKQLLGQNHMDYSVNLNNLGNQYYKLKQFSTAEYYHQQCRKIRKNFMNQHFIQYLSSLKNLYSIYYSQMKLQKARQVMQQSAAILKKNNLQNSVQYAHVLKNIGQIQEKLKNYQKAIEILKIVYDIYKMYFGDKNIQTLIVMKDIACTYQNAGNYEKALQIFLNNIDVFKLKFGQKSFEYGILMEDLGRCYSKSKNFMKAIFYIQTSIQIFKEIFKESHQKCIDLQLLLAYIYTNMDNLDYVKKSLPIFEEQLIKIKKYIGYKTPIYALTLNNMHSAYKKLNNIQKAIQVLEECIQIYLELYGQFNQQYERNLHNLGAIYCNFHKNYKKYLEMGQKVRKIRIKLYGQNSFSHAQVLRGLGICYQKLQQFCLALQFYQNCVGVCIYLLNEDDSRPQKPSLLSLLQSIVIQIKFFKIFIKGKDTKLQKQNYENLLQLFCQLHKFYHTHHHKEQSQQINQIIMEMKQYSE